MFKKIITADIKVTSMIDEDIEKKLKGLEEAKEEIKKQAEVVEEKVEKKKE
jgi:hypothetical protein